MKIWWLFVCFGLAVVVTAEATDSDSSSSATMTCENPSAPSDSETEEELPVEANEFSPLSLDKGVLSWIHNTEAGFYSPKQQFRHEDPDDPSSLAGIFAKERIERGELLCRVPWEYLVQSRTRTQVEEQLSCSTVRELARQMKLGKKSKFAPYVEYLKEQPDNQLPSAWSEEGKALLLEVLGQTEDENITPDQYFFPGIDLQVFHFPPNAALNWIEAGWYGECRGNRADDFGKKAAMMALLRADDTLMIPAYDFYNHRNGKWHNADTMIKTNHFHETRALRTIEAGEQVFISYNRCSGCGGRVEEGYSTAEMLRDYGFVEPFPQSWHFYNFREVEFELHHDEEAGYYEVEWKRQPDEYRAAMIQDWLRAQILRLNRLWHVTYRNRHDHEANGMPQNEWDMIWTFQKANLVAMRCALNALNGNTRTLVASTEAEVSVDDLYHNFQENAWESVDLELPQCNTEDFDHYMSIDSATSYLQTLNFSVLRLHQLDICMDRDSHIHVCSSFRPSYFEYFVHPAASLIKSVRRVLVMGSGASFLVHEVMKYSSTLELVVAIEPDQAVTRKSYQHFHVDPHFDDSRVEWWFGDFGESLSLMPVEYWNSFDLVLLDMAKYNYPFVFTDGKRFTDLVHKEGIMVSHDNHIRELSESFAFTSRLVYHLTPHCTQILTLGSHSVDLLYAPSHDHDIETLIYEPSLMKDHRRELIHDYISHSIESSDSNNIKAEEYTSSTDAIGVIQIVDVVNARTKNLDETMKVIEDEVTQRGFQVLSKFQLPTSDSVFVIMQEGYVVARVDAPNQYIGLDIFLSRKVTKRALLQSAIVDKLGATISSFRFVTNGMEVPVLNSSRSERSESVAIPSPGPLDVSIIESFLAESFQTFFDSPKHVLVICESPTDCPSHNWVVDLKVAESVHQLVMCSDLQNQENDSEESLVDSVIACEHEIQEWIETTIISNEIFVEAIFLDGGLSHHSLQILDAVVNVRQESRQSWIPEETLLVTLPTKDNKSQGRQSFGDRYHEVGTKWSDSTKVEFLVLDRDDSPLMEFGIISQGIENTLDEIEAFETSLTSKLNKLEKKVKIRQLRGQPLETSDILPARRFGHHQYDEPVEASGSTIRNGVQTFFQVDFMQEETSSMLTMDMLSTFVVDTLEAIGATTIQKHLSDNKTLRVFEFDSGHAIVALYPAKNTMEFNFFCQCKDEMENCVQDNLFMFVNTLFLQSSELGLYALDMFPRGPGKVLNFAQSQGDDDDDDDEYYEEEE